MKIPVSCPICKKNFRETHGEFSNTCIHEFHFSTYRSENNQFALLRFIIDSILVVTELSYSNYDSDLFYRISIKTNFSLVQIRKRECGMDLEDPRNEGIGMDVPCAKPFASIEEFYAMIQKSELFL